MDLGLKDKTALVVAASKGLGRAVAEELAAEGANLMICARNRDVLEAARDEIAKQTGADVRATTADVSQSEGITAVSSAAAQRVRPRGHLVTNAGGPPAGVFEMHDWAAWQRAVDLTLRSAVELTRVVLPGMRRAAMGARHPHHVDRRQAAGRQFDSLEQHPRRGHRLLTDARQRGCRRRRDGEHPPSRLHADRARRRADRRERDEGEHRRRRRSWRASSGRFRCIASPSPASSLLSPRSSRRSARATSPASRSSSTAAGSDR